MYGKRLLPVLLGITALFIAACSGPAPEIAPTDAPTESTAVSDESAIAEEMPTAEEEQEDSDESMAEAEVESPTDEPMAEEPASAVVEVERPAWQTIALTDAQTGETFTLADFEGQTVFVEPMATWCTNCAAQLRRVADARQQLDGEDYVFVALSLETNLEDSTLAAYAERSGYDWHFAVMTPEMLAAFIQEFGNPVSSAPSTPHFVIRPDGSYTSLRTGAKSVEQIVSEMQTESGV